MSHPLWFQHRLAVLIATVCAAAVALTFGLILAGSREQSSPALTPPPLTRHDRSIAWHTGPTLRELQAHFAVLRRPAAADNEALTATFTAATNGRPEIPEYVRPAGTVDGVSVYVIVYPIFQHETSGPVAAYQMSVAAGNTGLSYVPGHYLIFPDVVGDFGQTQEYLSVVPDGVSTVRWHFACSREPAGISCQRPAESTASVPVHDNLAVLPADGAGVGTADPSVDRVTWLYADGSRTTFTNEQSAVPFPGAPRSRTG